MSIGSNYKTGQEAPVSGIYRCEQCEKAGETSDMPLAKGNNFPPCSKCNWHGRPDESTYRLIKIFT